jgi:hypothetical protein
LRAGSAHKSQFFPREERAHPSCVHYIYYVIGVNRGVQMAQRTKDERGTFDTNDFVVELERARSTHSIGTALWFEDDRIRVVESKWEPGQRTPVHVHDKT